MFTIYNVGPFNSHNNFVLRIVRNFRFKRIRSMNVKLVTSVYTNFPTIINVNYFITIISSFFCSGRVLYDSLVLTSTISIDLCFGSNEYWQGTYLKHIVQVFFDSSLALL